MPTVCSALSLCLAELRDLYVVPGVNWSRLFGPQRENMTCWALALYMVDSDPITVIILGL